MEQMVYSDTCQTLIVPSLVRPLSASGGGLMGSCYAGL